MPSRHRQKWLNGEIELRTESPAYCRRDNSHAFRCNAENRGDIAAIHIGRLRAGLNFHSVTDSPSEPRLGFYVGVFHKSRVISTFCYDVGLGQSLVDVPSHNPSAHQNISWAVVMDLDGLLCKRSFDIFKRWQLFPHDGEVCGFERIHGCCFANHRRYGFTAMASSLFANTG